MSCDRCGCEYDDCCTCDLSKLLKEIELLREEISKQKDILKEHHCDITNILYKLNLEK